MINRRKKWALLMAAMVLCASALQDVWGAEAEPFEGRITQINEQRGTIVVNNLIIDASDFELGDLRVGFWVMGEFIRKNDKLHLLDLEVIK